MAFSRCERSAPACVRSRSPPHATRTRAPTGTAGSHPELRLGARVAHAEGRRQRAREREADACAGQSHRRAAGTRAPRRVGHGVGERALGERLVVDREVRRPGRSALDRGRHGAGGVVDVDAAPVVAAPPHHGAPSPAPTSRPGRAVEKPTETMTTSSPRSACSSRRRRATAASPAPSGAGCCGVPSSIQRAPWSPHAKALPTWTSRIRRASACSARSAERAPCARRCAARRRRVRRPGRLVLAAVDDRVGLREAGEQVTFGLELGRDRGAQETARAGEVDPGEAGVVHRGRR